MVVENICGCYWEVDYLSILAAVFIYLEISYVGMIELVVKDLG